QHPPDDSGPKMSTLINLFKDGFLRSMLLAVAIASLFPALGKSGGTLHIDAITNYGVALVFFLHGIGIPRERMRAGLAHWRVHVPVQAFTFLVFPLLFWLFRPLLAMMFPPMLLLGFFYLCALPSTITSSVALTGAARGNVPAAIFNATLSSLLGVVLTPLLVSVMAPVTGVAPSLKTAMLDIASLLLLPFVVGQLLHPRLWPLLAPHRRYTGLLDRGIVVMLVFASFSDSVAAGLWRDYHASTLLLTLTGTGLLLTIVLLLTRSVARLTGLRREDEIVVVFCGSKKTLAAGVPMAKVLFGAHPGLGLIVLPVMFYHQLQLVVCAALAQRYARSAPSTPAP
ncbi:MAG TPA: bile acid:sodium symporter family protein, partial [Moraxellaceae bacterium]|nr:bile acid:sodium symporter family protein [Moraxellaceae bacterium]